ncbi:MAG: hypothetical protein J0L93_05030 [Deltaproteobacteria bacterium]|nr:hypothetical protein [Deltaproteobacteria bacterium]
MLLKKNFYISYVIIFLISSSTFALDKICIEWFTKANIQPGGKCEWLCVSTPVDMSTFDCGGSCPELCKLTSENTAISTVKLYIPYLNFEEIKLSTKHPKEAWIVYQQKLLAEKATLTQFGRDNPDDESDAFRHFVWAALLSKELSSELAKTFLDAHEADEDIKSIGRAMDLANNRAGLATAETLRKKNNLNQIAIEKEAMKALKEKTLVIIRPRGD